MEQNHTDDDDDVDKDDNLEKDDIEEVWYDKIRINDFYQTWG